MESKEDEAGDEAGEVMVVGVAGEAVEMKMAEKALAHQVEDED